MKNRIYFFTGTGNSLKVANDIVNALPDSELIGIHKNTSKEILTGYDRVGFIFPNYAGGPPSMVAQFIQAMHLEKQGDTYIFAVATYGGNDSNLHAQIGKLLKQKGIRLNYGGKVHMYPNSVTANLMLKTVNFFAKKGENKTKSIIADILAKKENPIPALKESADRRYKQFMKTIHTSDNLYKVNNNCISCEICKKICPAQNIILKGGKPAFLHNCECCLACFQHCPRKAIYTSDRTNKQGRYSHPHIGYTEIVKHYK